MTTADDYVPTHSSRRRKPGLARRLLVGFGVGFALLLGLSACSIFGGNSVDQQTTTQMSLANQRKAALSLIGDYPIVETIRFTNEGRTVGPGGSLWAASAVVTVGGKDYDEGLGFDPGTSFGEGLPDAPPDAVPGPVTVIYSDGTSEVLN